MASQDVGKPSDQQITHRMARQRPMPTEAVLEGFFPHAPVIIIAGQGRKRHAEITRRDLAQFTPDAAGGTAIIGNGDHRSNSGHLQCAGCAESLKESMPAAEAHHRTQVFMSITESHGH